MAITIAEILRIVGVHGAAPVKPPPELDSRQKA